MAVRPFNVAGNRTLSRLHDLSTAALEEWIERWLPQAGGVTVDCASADARAGEFVAESVPAWIAVSVREGASIWIPDVVRETVHTLVFGCGTSPLRLPEAGPSLASEASSQALVDMASLLMARAAVEQVSGLTLVKDRAPPHETFRYGSGAVAIRCRLNGEPITMVLDGELVSEIVAGDRPAPSPRPPLDNPVAGLSNQAVELQGWIGEAEIDLATLQTIAVGDVIRLETKLDQTLQVRSFDGNSVCLGYLGTAGGHRAVELLREISITGD